jgi:hypothetical protein
MGWAAALIAGELFPYEVGTDDDKQYADSSSYIYLDLRRREESKMVNY